MKKQPANFEWFCPKEDEIRSALSSDHLWNEAGSRLFNCVRVLLAHTNVEDFRTTFVGEAEAQNISTDDLIVEKKTRVADMLIGMAIEAWLKGLIVLTNNREGLGDLIQKMNELTDERSQKMGLAEEATVHQISDAMQTPEIDALFEKISKESKALILKRFESLKAHHRHNLVEMAEAVGFNPPLSDGAVWTLRYYSQMIELGRYPSVKKIRHLVGVNDAAALESGRKELFRRIHEMHDSLSASV